MKGKGPITYAAGATSKGITKKEQIKIDFQTQLTRGLSLLT
jgi:hypothetical protein